MISAEAIRQLFIGLLRAGYWIRSPARAESMTPWIRRGDVLTVRPATFAEAKIGDILAYRREGTESVLTTHRVVQKGRDAEGPFVVTKGDRSRFRDLPIRRSTPVHGKVVSVERHGRVISLETRRHRVLGYLVARLSLGRWYLGAASRTPHRVPGGLMRRIARLRRRDA